MTAHAAVFFLITVLLVPQPSVASLRGESGAVGQVQGHGASSTK
jgi:hypothetical protein